MKLLTTKQVVIRIAIIISVAELLIMLMLMASPYETSIYSVVAFDTVLLAVLSIPAIYIWVIKPFVNARDDALAQISHLALTDPLTQLANRRLISKHLVQVIASRIRHKDYGAVLLIDLDGFKPVNDDHGHDAGDALLVEIAARFRSIVRAEDVAGRIGGDEFVVLIYRLSADERKARDMALRIAENLIKVVNKPFDFNGQILQVGASIGIRLLGFEEMDTVAAMNEADAAMYSAKQAGGGCAAFFEK